VQFLELQHRIMNSSKKRRTQTRTTFVSLTEQR
jgi:hypothetical protein